MVGVFVVEHLLRLVWEGDSTLALWSLVQLYAFACLHHHYFLLFAISDWCHNVQSSVCNLVSPHPSSTHLGAAVRAEFAAVQSTRASC